MILHRYFARRFALVLAWMILLFALLTALLEMVEILRRFGLGETGMGGLVALIALKVPSGLYPTLPLVMILAAIFTFLSLSRSSELTVARAAGRSAIANLLAPLAVALATGALVVAALNPIVAATLRQYDLLAARYGGAPSYTISVGQDGLWLRQGDPDGQVVIQARKANSDGTRLEGATFYGFTSEGRARWRIEAASARLVPGAWQLKDAKMWRFEGVGNPEAGALRMGALEIPSELSAEGIRDGFGPPSTISIWDLPAFIESLRLAGFSTRRHAVWMQVELARPLIFLSMVMIGAAFTMRPTRLGHTGLHVLLALLLGFGLYFIRNFAQVLGENGQIPVLLAAWAPPLAGILLAWGLLLHMEDA